MHVTRRKPKAGEVLFFFGRLKHENPDHIVMWSGGTATKRHANNVMGGFTEKRYSMSKLGQLALGNSFLEQLDAAGFDITTIQFSIRMKTPETAPGSAKDTQ